jgi:hypothetical protein
MLPGFATAGAKVSIVEHEDTEAACRKHLGISVEIVLLHR